MVKTGRKRLYDHLNRPILSDREKLLLQIRNQASFVAGDHARRSMRGWLTSDGDPNTDLNGELATIRERSRDLYRNTPLAAGALDRAAENVVGSGLRLQSRIKRKLLNIEDDAADQWERETEARFDQWASSKDADLARTLNFYEMTEVAFLSALMSGDCFAVMPLVPRPRSDCDLRISLYEGDYVSNPQMQPNSKNLTQGIEINPSTGAPVRYWFQKSHPGAEMPSFEWTPIPAFGSKSGRRNVIHLFKPKRPSQRRGYPILTPVVETLKQLSRYSESELMAAVVSSFFTVFIKQESKGDGAGLGAGYTDDQSILTGSDSDNKLIEMGNGTIIDLGENESIETADPKRPNDSFKPFYNAVVEQVGAATGIPFEVLIQHFSSSYSASRAALIEFWKFVTNRRAWLARNWCDLIYEEFLTDQIIKGKIKAPGFMDDNFIRFAWLGSAWQSNIGRGMIDPLKEIKAAKEKINARLGTYEDEYATMNGGDWESGMDRLGREEKFLNERNIQPVKTTAGGGIQ